MAPQATGPMATSQLLSPSQPFIAKVQWIFLCRRQRARYAYTTKCNVSACINELQSMTLQQHTVASPSYHALNPAWDFTIIFCLFYYLSLSHVEWQDIFWANVFISRLSILAAVYCLSPRLYVWSLESPLTSCFPCLLSCTNRMRWQMSKEKRSGNKCKDTNASSQERRSRFRSFRISKWIMNRISALSTSIGAQYVIKGTMGMSVVVSTLEIDTNIFSKLAAPTRSHNAYVKS